MVMAALADLNEPDPAGKVVHDLLVPLMILPLGREVMLAARDNDPKPGARPFDFLHLAHPAPLLRAEMNVAFKRPLNDPCANRLLEVQPVPVDEMVRMRIAQVNERVVHVDHLPFPVHHSGNV